LVHPENNISHFITYSALDTWLVVEVPKHSSHNDNFDGDNIEYLLVFQTLAIYVDQQGRRTRSNEIMYPATPTFITNENDFLLVYSETHLDVFSIESGDWVQSISLKKSRPLCNDGSLSLMMMNESPYVVYLANIMTRELVLIKNFEN
jgi:serine/threonine-protein kinase MRCK